MIYHFSCKFSLANSTVTVTSSPPWRTAQHFLPFHAKPMNLPSLSSHLPLSFRVPSLSFLPVSYHPLPLIPSAASGLSYWPLTT